MYPSSEKLLHRIEGNRTDLSTFLQFLHLPVVPLYRERKKKEQDAKSKLVLNSMLRNRMNKRRKEGRKIGIMPLLPG